MARYIDADELLKKVKYRSVYESLCDFEFVTPTDIDEIPTADVAPRVGFAGEIFEEIERIIEKSKYQQATPYGTEERYNPYVIVRQFAELKKKYTEEK